MRIHLYLKKHIVFLIFSGFINFFAPSSEAKEITIGVSHTRPPYIIQEKNSGVEIDITREIFKSRGDTVNFMYLTNERVTFFLKEGKVDGVLFQKSYDFKKEQNMDVFYSDDHITYHNYAISLSQNKLMIESIANLKDKRVLAFQYANKYLGPEFAEMAKQNPQYKEKPEQSLQVFSLFTGRTDVVIADKLIFLYHRKLAEQEGKIDLKAPVTFHSLFPPNPIHGVFLNAAIRDEFDAGLKKIHETGKYEDIVKQYEQMMNLQIGQ